MKKYILQVTTNEHITYIMNEVIYAKNWKEAEIKCNEKYPYATIHGEYVSKHNGGLGLYINKN